MPGIRCRSSWRPLTIFATLSTGSTKWVNEEPTKGVIEQGLTLESKFKIIDSSSIAFNASDKYLALNPISRSSPSLSTNISSIKFPASDFEDITIELSFISSFTRLFLPSLESKEALSIALYKSSFPAVTFTLLFLGIILS